MPNNVVTMRVAVAVVLLAGVTLVAYLLLREPARPAALTADQAREAAESSCRDLARFEALVKANASVERTLAALDEAVRKSQSAATADPLWLPLAGGAQSLQLALTSNDARAARVGADVVRSACRALT